MASTTIQPSPKLIEALSGKELKQVTAGVRHCAASNTTLPVRGVTNIVVPSTVPSQYSALKEIPCQAIHARLLLLNHFAKMITTSWRLFSIHSRPRVCLFSLFPFFFLLTSYFLLTLSKTATRLNKNYVYLFISRVSQPGFTSILWLMVQHAPYSHQWLPKA